MNQHNLWLGRPTVLAAGLVALASVQAARGDTTEGPFSFTNNIGMSATSLEVIFDGTAGSLSNPVVTTNPPGDATGVASLFSSNSGVAVNWTGTGVQNTQSAAFKVDSAFSPIAPASTVWKQFGNTISGTGPVWPVALAPSVTGNFGTDEVPSLHSALDIDAPKNQPVRAAVNSTLVGIGNNYILASDGTNLWAYAHVKKTVGNHGIDFVAGDIGMALTRGTNFAFITGTGNPGGGSFDHVHFEFIPGEGTPAKILVDPSDPSMGYKPAGTIAAAADPKRVNPLPLFDVKDPGDRAPTIGPIFFRPAGNNEAGYTEFGNKPTSPGVRKGTFINGRVSAIEQIYDNQGSTNALGIQPVGGSMINDPRDATIKIDNIIASDPYKVSYQVQGTGPVAAFGIPERPLVTFNQNDAALAPKTGTIYDVPTRDVTPPNPHPAYNHSFVLTNTDGTNLDATHVWNTIAPTSATADGVNAGGGFSSADNNAKSKFPDGIYQINGYGFDIGSDGNPAHKTSIDYMVRLNNWKQTAFTTHGGPTVTIPIRADDTFAKDGAETTMPLAGETFNRTLNEDIFGVGDSYLANLTYTWQIVPHQAVWTQDDALSCILCGTITTDANGHFGDSMLTNSANLAIGVYDLVVDYDSNNLFSWTLDGVGKFTVVPESATLGLLLVGLVAMLPQHRRQRQRNRSYHLRAVRVL